jgi:undecaprenyl diphosphate synthase
MLLDSFGLILVQPCEPRVAAAPLGLKVRRYQKSYAKLLKTIIGGNLNMSLSDKKNDLDHIAIMMDGNGRWATKRGLPRTAGHYAGMIAMRDIIRACYEKNIKCLTLYAFSTENWTRPDEEVNYLVNLPKLFFQNDIINELVRNNIQIRYIGDISRFPKSVHDIFKKTLEMTDKNTGMILNFAMNYGGRAEIIQAIKNYIKDYKVEKELSEELFEEYLYTKDCGAPDLIIRTSGEQRLSNFLLWQSAKAELWFTKTFWPDFNESLLQEAINDYKGRKQII